MAKTNIKNLAPTLEKIKEAVAELDERLYLELGEYIVKRIVQKAKSGKRMTLKGDENLPGLSAQYQKTRKEWVAEGRSDLDELFRPNRKSSNLTVTGQYLKSIRVVEIDRDKRVMIIEPTGTRKDGLTNEELRQHLTKLNPGYRIMTMDETGRKVLKTKVLNEIRKQLRKKLLRK